MAQRVWREEEELPPGFEGVFELAVAGMHAGVHVNSSSSCVGGGSSAHVVNDVA